MKKKAIFLDRDGTLIEEKNYLFKPEDVTFEKDVIPALQKLQEAGFLLFIITNQAGIGRGYFTEADFHAVQKHILNELSKHNITITQTYFCPHHPEAGIGHYLKNCEDRKPNPGMINRALAQHQLSAKDCFMIGDMPTDIQAGKNAGCKTILVQTGHAKNQTFPTPPDYIAPTLLDAVDNYIL